MKLLGREQRRGTRSALASSFFPIPYPQETQKDHLTNAGGSSNSLAETVTSSGHPEYVISDQRLRPSESIQNIVRDNRADIQDTWGQESERISILDGIRLRGDFRLLYVRIL